MNARIAIALLALFVLAGPVAADDPAAPPDNQSGRYEFSKVTDGMLRLDRQTGEVALCSPRAVGWACMAAPEDRTALENEIARLRSENAALKQALLSHGMTLPAGVMPESRTGHENDVTIRLPDNADLDRAADYIGRIWNRFVDALMRAKQQMLNKS